MFIWVEPSWTFVKRRSHVYRQTTKAMIFYVNSYLSHQVIVYGRNIGTTFICLPYKLIWNSCRWVNTIVWLERINISPDIITHTNALIPLWVLWMIQLRVNTWRFEWNTDPQAKKILLAIEAFFELYQNICQVLLELAFVWAIIRTKLHLAKTFSNLVKR